LTSVPVAIANMNVFSWHTVLPFLGTVFGLWTVCQFPEIQNGSLAFLSTQSQLALRPLFREAATAGNPGGDFLRKLVNTTINLCEDYLKSRPDVNFTDRYPYWRFIPVLLTTVQPGSSATAHDAQGACFSLKLSAEFHDHWLPKTFGHYVRLKVEASGESNVQCKDNYMVALLGLPVSFSVDKPGQQNVDIHVGNADAVVWDAKTRGARVFHIAGSTDEAVWALLETVRMFEPLVGAADVKPATASRALDFLEKYAGIAMPPRTGQLNVDIPEETVQDGDFFGLMRLDGLDPMIAWAMGSTTGHTTMALRFEGKLHVVESTGKTNYWPVDGIQKTEWSLWLKQYRAADYNVVHLPLSKTMSDRFNATAAREAFTNEYEGFAYGFKNMLWSWLDTLDGNWPCMPKESSVQGCLSWELFEVIISVLEELSKDTAELIFLPGLRRRVDLPDNSSWAEVMQAAYEKFDGQVAKLPTLPEQDSWSYETTKYGKKAQGPARMCDALVCSLWKAGGLFGDIADDIQCTEFTNWDAWGLKFFDTDAKSKRPEACKIADPDNDLCQLSGKYSLRLKTPAFRYNERDPHPHMAENCPTKAPDYVRSETC